MLAGAGSLHLAFFCLVGSAADMHVHGFRSSAPSTVHWTCENCGIIVIFSLSSETLLPALAVLQARTTERLWATM